MTFMFDCTCVTDEDNDLKWRGKTYCNVSINRVMVRFKSLSERRISSILLIE